MNSRALAMVVAGLSSLLAAARAQQPLLQLQGEPYFEGAMTLHVTAPSDIGDIVWIGVGLDPLPLDSPVATNKGPWYIGNLLTTLIVGTIPANGRLDLPFTMPPASPGVEGTVLALQAYVPPVLSNPATLPMDQPHHLPSQAIDLTSPNPIVGGNFGDRVAVGDLNADGIEDLVVGSWFEDYGGIDKSGRVYVLWGPSFTAHETLAPAVPVNYGTYGASVTVADFTGDGVDDLLVAETPSDPPAPNEIGKLHLFEGGPAFSIVPIQTISSLGSGVPYGNYGRTVAVGDFDDDGSLDIAVGNMNETIQGFTEAGRIDVFWGPGFVMTTTIPNPEPKSSDFFGSALAVADVDGDGVDDLIEGSGRADAGGVVNQGRVYVYVGPALSLAATLDNPYPQGFNSRFGEQVWGADLDGDGMAEVIACDLKNRVYVFEAPDLSSFIDFRKPEAINTVDIGSISFGYYLGSGDINSDSVLDIMVSDIFEGSLSNCAPLPREGLLFVAMGPYYATFYVMRSSTPACGNNYSWAFLISDIDRDGKIDVISNSPTADIDQQNSGMVQIITW